MSYSLWSQDIFSKGELSPYMYARVTVNEYNNGLKTAQNVLTFPSGAAGKRFGTLYQATLQGFTSFNQIYFQTFQYLNEAVYQLVFAPGNIYIYLEGILVATVTNSLLANQIFEMSTTVLGPLFRCTGVGFQPIDLSRTPNSGIVVVSFTSSTFTLTSAGFTENTIYPIKFSVSGGTIMQTNPQIAPGVTYFVYATSGDTALLFPTAQDAKAYAVDNTQIENAFVITGLGTGTTTATVQNTWTFANSTFKNLPVYDFNGPITSYDALTFTPSATSGAGVIITVSGAGYPPLDTSYVGGAFIGGGGTARITQVASATEFQVAVQTPFDNTSAIQGSLAFLAEPAWSTKRGFPQVCSSYQNRALFANTASLPNGFYASVINDYTDFGDLTGDDDDAISWYPTSNNMNYIKFIVPYRSLTVHTNTGIYSSPLSDVVAITPSNFTLQLQDSTPADVLQPQAIDNQVLVLSGNDAHQMLWDGINNAYTSNIVSVVNEQVIRDPVDETAFQDLHRAGSRFVFIINANGSMAVFQTLLSENVSGFTIQTMEQSYGNASFLQSASSSDGRCWFVVQRQIAEEGDETLITNFTANTLFAAGSNLGTTPVAIMFGGVGSLPLSSPALNQTSFFWGVGVDVNNFMVYTNVEDAIANTNPITFTSAGINISVVAWPLSTIFTLEELTHDVYLDCAVSYNGVFASTIPTGNLFNAQDVKMIGDGFGFIAEAETNTNNQINFFAHGSPVEVSSAFIGFPITTIIETMPLSISSGQSSKETTLTKPKHIRFLNFMFHNTIGGEINGVPIAIEPFSLSHIGEPPFPASGLFEISVFKAWDDFNNPSYTIIHDEPFAIELLGAFFTVEL